jgi:flagellar motor switch protein FliG
MQSGKITLTDAQLNKLSLSQLFDKVVLNKNLNVNDIKTILVKYIGEDGFKRLSMSVLKSGEKELLSMTSKEFRTALYKELGEGSLWTKPLQDLKKELQIRVPGHYEYISAISDEIKTKIPPEVQKIFNQLKTMGFDDTEASYWTSQIMTKSPEQIVGKMENLIDNAYNKQKLAELIQYGNTNTTTVQILESAGLNPSQITDVIKASALSHEDPKTFVTAISKIDPKSAAVTMQMLSKDELASSLIHFKPAYLTSIIDSASSSSNLSLIATMLPLMSAETITEVLNTGSIATSNAIISQLPSTSTTSILPQLNSKSLTNIFMTLTSDQINSILPKISPENLSKIVSKMEPKTLSRIIPNLNSNQVRDVFSALTPEQLNEVAQELTPEQLNSITTKLTTKQAIKLSEILKIPDVTIPGPTPPPPTPTLPTPLLLKSNKPILDASNNLTQGATLFEVKLTYNNNNSQIYKVQAKSFHGAANQALLKRTTSQLPIDIKVTIKYQLNESA